MVKIVQLYTEKSGKGIANIKIKINKKGKVLSSQICLVMNKFYSFEIYKNGKKRKSYGKMKQKEILLKTLLEEGAIYRYRAIINSDGKIGFSQTLTSIKKSRNYRRKSDRIKKAKRRGLGFYCLNTPFKRSEGHHISKNIVVYIPKKLHKQYTHNVFSGVGMFDSNATTFNWLSGRYIRDWEMKELSYILKCNEEGTRSNEETKKRIFELFAGLNRREG